MKYMSLKKLKNKAIDAMGNERLGSVEEVKVEQPQLKPEKKKRAKKNTPSKQVQPQVAVTPPGKKKKAKLNIDKNTAEDLKDIYKALNVPQRREVKDMISPEDVKQVQFTPTSPVGLDIDEVEDFVYTIELGFQNYLEVVNEREADVLTLVKEIARIQKIVMELQHEQEMKNLLSGENELDKLKSKITDLTIENRELNSKLRSAQQRLKTDVSTEALMDENDTLRVNNQFLTERNAELTRELEALHSCNDISTKANGRESKIPESTRASTADNSVSNVNRVNSGDKVNSENKVNTGERAKPKQVGASNEGMPELEPKSAFKKKAKKARIPSSSDVSSEESDFVSMLKELEE